MTDQEPSAGAVHPRNGTGRHIDQFLKALTAYGCEWRTSEYDLHGWEAQCPVCRRRHPHPPRSLKLHIDNDGWMDEWEYVQTGTLTIGCSRRCCSPNVLRRLLMRHPDRIAYERRIRELQAEVRFWIEFARDLNCL